LSVKNILCILPIESCQLPSGEQSRLQRLPISTNNDRFELSFDTSGTQQSIWVIPSMPSCWQGNGTLQLDCYGFMESSNSGNIQLAASIEAVTPGDTLNLNSAASFDSSNSQTQTVAGTTGNVFLTTITLTNRDSVSVGDCVRIKLQKTGGSSTGNYRLYGVNLVESGITNLKLGDFDTIELAAGMPLAFPSSQGSDGQVLTTDGSGNLSWGGIPTRYSFGFGGGSPAEVALNVGFNLNVDYDGTIEDITLISKTGPIGDDLIVDVNLNGTSIWNSTPSNRVKIVDGSTFGRQTSFDTSAVSKDDVLSIDVDQIGSTFAGQDCVLQIKVLSNIS
jgi:hypothetical protein